MKRGSATALLVGRWGMALSLVIGAVVIGRLIRDFPYLLPNRLPGLVLYELGPALALGLAIGAAVGFTGDSGPRFGVLVRFGLFKLATLAAGAAFLVIGFAGVLQGQ